MSAPLIALRSAPAGTALLAVVAAALAAACAGRAPVVDDGLGGGGTGQHPRPGEPAVVTEARANFPRTIDMHQKIVSRSCAPNAGVCHNTSNYPDLSTTGGLLQAVDAWCNLEMPDPTQGFDMCERKGDTMVIDDVLISEIAHFSRDALDHWTFTLRDAAPADVVAHSVYFYESVPDKPVLLPAADWLVQVDMTAGEKVATISVNGVAENPFIEQYVDEVLASLVPGDANENGVFGFDTLSDDGSSSDGDAAKGARLIEPGSLARSYLWGRITATVPGTRMPLANQPLSDSEYVAVACFIETLGENGGVASAEDEIDYDNCAFARDPVSYAVDTQL